MSRRRTRTCHGKVRFKDKTQALGAVRGMQRAALFGIRRGDSRRLAQRAYRCAVCNGWHVTSQEAA